MRHDVNRSLGNGHRWMAVAAGVLLLAGQLSQAPQEPTAAADEVAPPLDERLETALLRVNPQLGALTSGRIADAVIRCGEQQGLSPELVLAVILVESSARPHARSPKGAVGLMQVMPYMYRELGLPGSVAHLEGNIEAGCLLLADNIRRLGEDGGISAYFWGDRIRGDGYLRRVRAMRQELAVEEASSPRPQRG
jgi:soluble lytic murein transglycosylase-like protein